jgi:hypothetical protein
MFNFLSSVFGFWDCRWACVRFFEESVQVPVLVPVKEAFSEQKFEKDIPLPASVPNGKRKVNQRRPTDREMHHCAPLLFWWRICKKSG